MFLDAKTMAQTSADEKFKDSFLLWKKLGSLAYLFPERYQKISANLMLTLYLAAPFVGVPLNKALITVEPKAIELTNGESNPIYKTWPKIVARGAMTSQRDIILIFGFFILKMMVDFAIMRLLHKKDRHFSMVELSELKEILMGIYTIHDFKKSVTLNPEYLKKFEDFKIKHPSLLTDMASIMDSQLKKFSDRKKSFSEAEIRQEANILKSQLKSLEDQEIEPRKAQLKLLKKQSRHVLFWGIFGNFSGALLAMASGHAGEVGFMGNLTSMIISSIATALIGYGLKHGMDYWTDSKHQIFLERTIQQIGSLKQFFKDSFEPQVNVFFEEKSGNKGNGKE